jgi:rhamnose utilization protein RhaD (predicted bifunctional aldolase and dehydrogenase)/NAD(P)-dependent dehydrogenase (short-subunit alcohol dehydrogenase family)
VKSGWNDDEAAAQADDLDLLVYVSRLLGADTSLVLAGGGNTSVKTIEADVFGDDIDVLHVKGSGGDMASIERGGFARLRLDHVSRLAALPELSDSRMATELQAASLDPGAPAPSVESILHAVLPHRYVLHTHADAVLALTNTPEGASLVAEVYGADVVVIPYVMPGFELARACAERFHAGRHEGTVGMVLLHHGLFTFAHDARTAYEHHIELVGRALVRVESGSGAAPAGIRAEAAPPPAPPAVEGSVAVPGTPPAVPGTPETADAREALGEPADVGDRLEDDLDVGAFGAGDATAFGAGAGVPGGASTGSPPSPDGSSAAPVPTAASPAPRTPPGGGAVLEGELGAVAVLRRDLSAAAGQPMVVRTATSEAARRFATRDDLAVVSQVGPATPDHVLRTKRVPLVGRDVAGYARSYEAYVDRNRGRLGDRVLVPVDPAPRVVVDPELGVLGAGRTPADAAVALEIYDHTIWVIEKATALGGYAAVPEADLFDVEYWELEQAKLARRPAPPPLAGRVALVTGAASGIGLATTRALLAAGAAVVGLDLAAAVDDVADGPDFVGIRGDVADGAAVGDAVAAAISAFGGLDALVLNAGVFPDPEPVATLSTDVWDHTFAVNAGAAVVALRAAHPFLRVSPVGGSVVVVASKNVPAPGSGAAAYSASKAALTQLARVAALEWGADGIRVNVVHPDAVFDTGLWTEALIAERAAAYGLTPEQYRTRNVLGAEVSSTHVADAVVALCGPTFARTTGAQLAVDGGNDRVI